MGQINKQTHIDLYKSISQSNLERQFSVLSDMIHVGLIIDFKVNLQIILSLHSAATTHVVETPGKFRWEDAHIMGSDHELPHPATIEKHVYELIAYLHNNWEDQNEFELAAYALWRLVWIHPFEDGNGRTARALSYLIICLKLGAKLFGANSYVNFIRGRYEKAYVEHLRHADQTSKAGNVDVIPLANFLAEIVKLQLQS